jgi:hypothetical protein
MFRLFLDRFVIHFLFVSLVAGCDTTGHLRVIVVEEAIGPTRSHLTNASVEIYQSGSGEALKAEPMFPPGQFLYGETPYMSSDTIVVVKCEGYSTQKYKINDLCVDSLFETDRQICRKAFLYATMHRIK